MLVFIGIETVSITHLTKVRSIWGYPLVRFVMLVHSSFILLTLTYKKCICIYTDNYSVENIKMYNLK